MTVEDACAAYVRYLESLDRAGVDDLHRHVTDTVHFRDPFNDVHGLEKMRSVFADMFETVDAPRFEVARQVCDNDVCYLDWRFSGSLRAVKGADPWSIDGVSRLRFDPSGRVAEHVDYWDAASGLYESIPVLGWVLRVIRRRISVDPPVRRRSPRPGAFERRA